MPSLALQKEIGAPRNDATATRVEQALRDAGGRTIGRVAQPGQRTESHANHGVDVHALDYAPSETWAVVSLLPKNSKSSCSPNQSLN